MIVFLTIFILEYLLVYTYFGIGILFSFFPAFFGTLITIFFMGRASFILYGDDETIDYKDKG